MSSYVLWGLRIASFLATTGFDTFESNSQNLHGRSEGADHCPRWPGSTMQSCESDGRTLPSRAAFIDVGGSDFYPPTMRSTEQKVSKG